MGGDFLPETEQAGHAVVWGIANDNRGVNCADGDPRHPVRQIFRRRQGLVNPRLIAPKRAATLQNQADLLVIR